MMISLAEVNVIPIVKKVDLPSSNRIPNPSSLQAIPLDIQAPGKQAQAGRLAGGKKSSEGGAPAECS